MGDFALYLAFMIPPLLIGLAVQAWLKRTFAKYSGVEVSSGLNGAQVAREILDRNGLQDVPVEASPGGALSDHYDPRKKALFLSEPVYRPSTVAATAVAAHETGHALQDARGYAPLKIRSAIYPAVAFASNAWIWLLLLGAVLGALNLVALALILYAVAVAFHIVTLPVEFNASRRAGGQLRELGLVSAGENEGVQKVLNAAALTYVAGALAALSLLLYYALVFFGNRD
ncbi:MAG: zinc metallopeptidase [Gaiellaceae bacterium]